MFSWVLLVIVLAAFVVLGVWFWGSVFGRGEVLPPLDPDETRRLNQQAVGARDLDSVQFELVYRGYRPEQVDDVIGRLSEQLKKAEETIARLSSPKSD
ncbi:MAG: DivIVA domain-containing protein [Corynebacterium marinum]|jgi:DivIVA domain-containing protein|uniref:DivIVA domain-containing protein n=1 Tax=Corynebacterium marinum TaxID=349751 RepID=A0A847HBK3_9CORY|nr:DivIVA domain-containing protein [Corynebacterium marinum]